jgi:uncharacterized protein (TIGR04551 family)
LKNLRSPLVLPPSLLRYSLGPALALLLSPAAAWAQFGGQPGGMQPGGMGPQPGEEPRDEGPAEEAPEEEEQPRDLEPLGAYAGQSRRTAQVVEIDGYLRLRTDFLHKLHLDQTYMSQATAGGGATASMTNLRTPPFPVPLECPVAEGRCSSKNLGSGNLRLRLEPTINVTDQVRVVAQVDVLDNTIMGSTPGSLIASRLPGLHSNLAPSSALYGSQDPPEIGRNGLVTSIRAKRAWGEVDSEFGSLRFGRMPWHFGRGIAFNNGNCPDCEGGTTVDRLMGITQLYGHQVALSWDFGAQGHHIGMIDYGRLDPGGGPPLDLSQRDDVLQLMLGITKLDDERRFQERAAQGELMFNYGLQLVYREQGQDIYDLTPEVAKRVCPPAGVLNGTPCTPGATIPLSHDDLNKSITFDVDALVFLPSLWMKLGWKALTVEAEASGVIGKIDDAKPLVTDSDATAREVTLQQLGWVVASELRLYRNAFFLGFETGGATGDQAEDPSTYLNYRWKFTKQPTGDRKIKDFKFSPEYHVDEILFRRILGTVSNAVYVKPQMTYWLDLAERRQVGLNAAFIYSMALESVSTPGNALPYGVEMNLGLNYRNPSDGFYAGFTWAVLWPMGALNRFQDGNIPSQDASSAQALRTFFGIRF